MQTTLIPTNPDKTPTRANNEQRGAVGIALVVWLLGGGLGLAFLVFLLAKIF